MRIIAGKYGGRTFRAPPGLSTRPTAARVREALFSILGDLENKAVLDCYAGSGALGLEALSRGARLVVFVEHSAQAIKCISANLAQLRVSQGTKLIGRGLLQAQQELAALAPFDWVLADPPWAVAQQALLEVEETTRGLLAPEGQVVVGHRAKMPIDLPAHSSLQLTQKRSWGDSGLSWFGPSLQKPA